MYCEVLSVAVTSAAPSTSENKRVESSGRDDAVGDAGNATFRNFPVFLEVVTAQMAGSHHADPDFFHKNNSA